MNYLKDKFPSIRKVHYFTDGCAGQYKNKNNFINLCHHKEDFAVDAEWNFFATSHGKSACDSIGDTDKQLVTKASLQRPYTELILTADAIVNFYEVNIPGIKFFNVKSEEVSESPVTLQGRFLKARTVKGTQQYHRFVSVKKNLLFMSTNSAVKKRGQTWHTPHHFQK